MASKPAPVPALTQTFRPRPRLWAALGLFAAGAMAFHAVSDWRDRHAILINTSDSLPNWAFVIHKTAAPKRGEYVFFVPRRGRW